MNVSVRRHSASRVAMLLIHALAGPQTPTRQSIGMDGGEKSALERMGDAISMLHRVGKVGATVSCSMLRRARQAAVR
jgi:hypothetical protein